MDIFLSYGLLLVFTAVKHNFVDVFAKCLCQQKVSNKKTTAKHTSLPNSLPEESVGSVSKMYISYVNYFNDNQ